MGEKCCSCKHTASLEPDEALGAFASSFLVVKCTAHHWQLVLFQVATPGRNKIKYPSPYDSLISMYVQMYQPNEAMPLQQTAVLSIVEASEYEEKFGGKERLLVKHK